MVTGTVNAFSVDVEDWYQVADFDAVVGFADWDRHESRVARNTDRILALCDEAGVRGTFFVLTWNAERHPEIVRRIAAAGHEIASHGYAHRLIYEQTPETFRDDITRAKATLEDITGTAVLGYRAPSASVTPRSLWALDVLLDVGLRYDSSIFPIRDTLSGPWELDPEQPRMRTAGRRGFSTHYVGLRGTYGKLRRLFRDFRFAPLRDVLGL